MDKYNYVIFGPIWDFYAFAFNDVIKLPNVKYITPYIPLKPLRWLNNIHMSSKINSVIRLPFKKIWNSYYCREIHNNNKPFCFIILLDWFAKDTGFVEYLRDRYPLSKIVFFFGDLLGSRKMQFSGKDLDIDHMKSISDMMITYDIDESRKYGIHYHHIPYSYNSVAGLTLNRYVSDIYFLGKAKNRLQDVYDAFYKLKEHGLRLKFILAEVPIGYRINEPEIIYLDSKPLSYLENLRYVVNSKCLLEIIQHNSSGYTSRTLEAIMYEKKIITNNTTLGRAPFYNPDYISIINTIDSIDTKFLKSIKENNNTGVDYNYKNELSPVEFLKYIEKNL